MEERMINCYNDSHSPPTFPYWTDRAGHRSVQAWLTSRSSLPEWTGRSVWSHKRRVCLNANVRSQPLITSIIFRLFIYPRSPNNPRKDPWIAYLEPRYTAHTWHEDGSSFGKDLGIEKKALAFYRQCETISILGSGSARLGGCSQTFAALSVYMKLIEYTEWRKTPNEPS